MRGFQKYPPKQDFVRAVSIQTGYLIQCQGPNHCILTYLAQVDPRGNWHCHIHTIANVIQRMRAKEDWSTSAASWIIYCLAFMSKWVTIVTIWKTASSSFCPILLSLSGSLFLPLLSSIDVSSFHYTYNWLLIYNCLGSKCRLCECVYYGCND